MTALAFDSLRYARRQREAAFRRFLEQDAKFDQRFAEQNAKFEGRFGKLERASFLQTWMQGTNISYHLLIW